MPLRAPPKGILAMPTRCAAVASAALLFLLLQTLPAACQQETPEQKQAFLQKMAVESSNPVGELWLITNQFDLNLEQSPNGQSAKASRAKQKSGNASNKNAPLSVLQPQSQALRQNFQQERAQLNYNLQPVLKFDLNSDWRFLTRPVIPIYNSPEARGRAAVDEVFGLGDIELKGVLSPNAKGPGFKWGVGPSAVFPTATDTRLGNGKWQLGGAMTVLYTTDKLVVGMFPEHWWSVAGDPKRPAVSLTKVQYFLWYSVLPTWQVGLAPTVSIDWLQPRAEDAVTLPIGLGLSKTVLLGKIPVKFSVEADYAVIRPRNLPGDEWTLKFSIVPIIPALF